MSPTISFVSLLFILNYSCQTQPFSEGLNQNLAISDSKSVVFVTLMIIQFRETAVLNSAGFMMKESVIVN